MHSNENFTTMNTPEYLVEASGLWDGFSEEDYQYLLSLAYNLLDMNPQATPADLVQYYNEMP